MKWVWALALPIVFLIVVTSLPGGIRPAASPGSSPVIGEAGNFVFGDPSPLQIRAAPHPLSTITLAENGLSPALVSLTWTATSDSFWSSYEVDYSTSSSSGPWFLLANITSSQSSNNEWAYGVAPQATYYWQVIQWGNFIGYYRGGTSNALEVTQPGVASLTNSTPSGTSVTLYWTNAATYGGNISFGSYAINESVNGGAYSTINTITQAGTRSYTVNGLAPNTSFQFYIATSDEGEDGGHYYGYTTTSNSVPIGTVHALVASASVRPSFADVGQLVSSSCVATGGYPAYTFSWSFGDGASGSGGTSSHRYSTPGTFTVTCTVTDSHSSSGAKPSGGHRESSSLSLSLRKSREG